MSGSSTRGDERGADLASLLTGLVASLADAVADRLRESGQLVDPDAMLDRRTCSSLGIGPAEYDAAAKAGAFETFVIGKRHVARRRDVIVWATSRSASAHRAELRERARGVVRASVEQELDELGVDLRATNDDGAECAPRSSTRVDEARPRARRRA